MTIVTLACADMAKEYGVRAVRTLVRPNGSRLQLIAKLIEAGKIKPLIDNVLPASEIQAAHRLSESGRAKGKIVIKFAY